MGWTVKLTSVESLILQKLKVFILDIALAKGLNIHAHQKAWHLEKHDHRDIVEQDTIHKYKIDYDLLWVGSAVFPLTKITVEKKASEDNVI